MKNVHSVFIVDDDPTNNMICKKMIEKSGFSENVTCYTDANEALKQLQSLDNSNDFPQVIFLDINMPPTSGWEFLTQYQKLSISKPLKIFMLSSGISDEHIKKAKEINIVTDVIDKPLSEEKLRTTVSKYI
ncbi:response regulator [Limibacter armeniacum]|uniref:response regulator n=1 Tax=Limibacter armeniacum TaxID=466084 RepID=UPI002FE5A642